MKIIKNNRGLTLVEIVVSLAILGIIITPLATLFVSSVKNNVSANERLRANQLAQKYMEVLMDNPLASIPTSEGIYTIEKELVEQNAYKNESERGTNTITYDDVIDFSKLTGVANGDKLTMDIDSAQIKIKDTSSTLKSKAHTNSSINIQIMCSSENAFNINLDVSNNSGKIVKLYKVYTKDGKDNIIVNTTKGEVYTYENLYDVTVGETNKNVVYKIKVTVKKGTTDVLAELVTFETIK